MVCSSTIWRLKSPPGVPCFLVIYFPLPPPPQEPWDCFLACVLVCTLSQVSMASTDISRLCRQQKTIKGTKKVHQKGKEAPGESLGEGSKVLKGSEHHSCLPPGFELPLAARQSPPKQTV